MDATLVTLLLAAVFVIGAGVRMMYCGHRHRAQRDRHADDRRPT